MKIIKESHENLNTITQVLKQVQQSKSLFSIEKSIQKIIEEQKNEYEKAHQFIMNVESLEIYQILNLTQILDSNTYSVLKKVLQEESTLFACDGVIFDEYEEKKPINLNSLNLDSYNDIHYVNYEIIESVNGKVKTSIEVKFEEIEQECNLTN